MRRRPFREKLVIWLALFLGAVVVMEGIKGLVGRRKSSPIAAENSPAPAPSQAASETLEISEAQEAVVSVPRSRPSGR